MDNAQFVTATPLSSPIVSGSGRNGRSLTVAVDGNIGSGKSTFLEYCRRQPNMAVYQEPMELWRNVGGANLLANFYNDPERWALAFQMAVGESLLDIYTKDSWKTIKVAEHSLIFRWDCIFYYKLIVVDPKLHSRSTQ